jgi:hypothetical protein
MKQRETLREISELILTQEAAIEKHQPPTSSVYKNLRDVIIAGQHAEYKTETGKILTLSNNELSKINHYLTSSSFISAWYHLSGNKENRDKAAHSCTQLISTLGPHDEEVLRKYIETEKLWRSAIKKWGAAPKQIAKKLLIFLLIIGVVCYWFWMR